MQAILAKCDFTISTLYMDLSTGHELLVVKVFDGALAKTEKRDVSVIGDGDLIFEQDPIRLLRLMKNRLQYPDFRFDATLRMALSQCDVTNCLKTFLSTCDHQAARISTFLEDLFSRFPEMEVIKTLKKSGIFETITGISNGVLEKNLSILKNYFHAITEQSAVEYAFHSYPKKVGFFFFCTALYCHIHHQESNLEDWPFYGVIQKIKPLDRCSLPVLQNFIRNQEMYPQYEGSLLYRMLEQLEMHNFASILMPL